MNMHIIDISELVRQTICMYKTGAAKKTLISKLIN